MASVSAHEPGQIELLPELRAELFAPGAWDAVLETFARTMRVAVALTDSEGHLSDACHNPQPIWTLGNENGRKSGADCPFCLSPHLACTGAREAMQKGEMVIATDLAGLSHVTVPLSLGGR